MKLRRMIPWRFNEAQVKFQVERQWFIDKGLPIRIVACKSRRAGISSVVEGDIYHDTTTHPLTYSLIVGNQLKPSENVMQMAQGFWRSTPEQIGGIRIRPRLPDSYRNNPPTTEISFPDLDSHIYIATAKSVNQYLSFGFQNIHATEVAYYKDGADLFRTLEPTLVDDAHSMLVMESTPNGMSGEGGFFYRMVMEAHRNVERDLRDWGVTRLVFIPWHEMTYSFRVEFKGDTKAAVDRKRKQFFNSYSKEELEHNKKFPKTQPEQYAWRRAVLRRTAFQDDPELFDQEYPSDLVTAFLSTGSRVFSKKSLKYLLDNARPRKWQGDIYWGDSTKANKHERVYDVVRRPRFLTRGDAIAEGFESHVQDGFYGNLKVWDVPEKDDRIFITGDVGWGDPGARKRGADYSVLKVGRLSMGNEPDEVLMTWKGHLNPLDFAEVASALAWWCYNKVGETVTAPELCIEWNGPGIPCNTYLDKHKLYPHTYQYVQPAVRGQPQTRHIGWETNDKTKPQMVSYLQRMIEARLFDEPDIETILEMAAYRKKDNYGSGESYGGEEGMHDDLVTADEILAVRLRYNAGSGEPEKVSYVDESDGYDPELVAWDPHGDSEDPLAQDVEDDEDEELWYHKAG